MNCMLPFITSKYREKRLEGYIEGGYLRVQDHIDLDIFSFVLFCIFQILPTNLTPHYFCKTNKENVFLKRKHCSSFSRFDLTIFETVGEQASFS